MTDDRALAAALEKADRGIDLRSHAARREMPFAMKSLDLLQADLRQFASGRACRS